MSWLNFNEGLNSIKGQLTNLAQSVLTEDDGDSVIKSDEYEELKKICLQQEQEIAKLRKENEEFQKNNVQENENWNWVSNDDPPNVNAETTKALKKEIERLQNENKDLIGQLEQLDSDNQQNVCKIMQVKNEIQNELENIRKCYSELEQLHKGCPEKEKILQEKIANISETFEKEFASQKKIENDLREKYENLLIDFQRITNKFTDTENELKAYANKETTEKEKLKRKMEENENLLEEIQNLKNELAGLRASAICSNAEKDQILEELKESKKSYVELEQLYKSSLTKEKLQLQELNDIKAIHEAEMLKIKASEENFRLKYENLLKENEVNENKKAHLDKLNTSEDGLIGSEEEKLKTNCEELTDCDLQDPSSHSGTIDGCKVLDNLLKSYSDNVSRLKEIFHSFTSENQTGKLQEYSNLLKTFEEQLRWFSEQNNTVKNKYSSTDMFKKHVDNVALASLVGLNEMLQKKLHSKTQDDFLKNHDYINKIREAFLEIKHSGTPSGGLDFYNNNTELDELTRLLQEMLSFMFELKSKVIVLSDSNINIISEKNQEIERLMETTDQLSQEVLEKSQTIKEYEHEIGELSRNNDLLIADLEVYKNNHLETISEIDEDKTILLEEQLEKANAEIEELKSQLNNTHKPEGEETIEKGDNSYLELLNKHDDLQIEHEILKRDYSDIEKELQSVLEENSALNSSVDSLKANNENFVYIQDEIKTLNESLQAEIGIYKEKIDTFFDVERKLKEANEENLKLQTEMKIIKEKLIAEENAKNLLQTKMEEQIEKLKISKMNETSLKLQYDTLNKEYMNAVETVMQLEENVKQLKLYQEESQDFKNKNEALKMENQKLQEIVNNYEENDELKKDDLKPLQEELQDIRNENEELKLENKKLGEILKKYEEISEKETEAKLDDNIKQESFEKLHDVEQENLQLQKQLETLKTSQAELIQLVTTKHQENIAYHSEIQRLTQIITNESQKCLNLETQINNLNQIISNERQQKEKVTEENTNLKEQCNLLSQNILEEQRKFSRLLEEKSQPTEAEVSLKKKLERLQTHLVELEEHYTSELYEAEQKNLALQLKVNEIEEREKSSSTMYTSVSIRANQQVESLQKQLLTMSNERDSLRKQISDLEDTINKQSAALTNLQLVLEQFRKDKEKEVHKETERLRRQINAEKKTQDELRKEITSLQSQLEESKQGLLAASRLSDQLEMSRNNITALKEEVHQLQNSLASKQEELKATVSQTDGKVDKSLMKNLIIGLVTCNNNLSKDQSQILKIIGNVLDFDQLDHDKLQLNKGFQGSWLSGFLSPQTNSQNGGQESLSRAFIEFLEKESKPRVVPSLLNTNSEASEPASRRPSTPRQIPANLTEIVLPTFADFAQSRNSSSILKDVLKDNS